MYRSPQLIPVDKTERGKMLVELITEKQRKDEEEHIEETTDTLAVLQTDDNQGKNKDYQLSIRTVVYDS